MAGEVPKPHDHLFRSVFGENQEAEAAALLQAYLPQTVGRELTTREPERWHRFAEAVRRQVPGGGKLMNKTQEMLEIYGEVMQQEARQKGLQEGRQEGRLGTIEKFRQAGVEWSTIEAATGVDEATFDRLKHQLDADDGATHGN